MFDLFKKASKKNTSLKFDRKLINKFQKDHKKLVETIQTVFKALEDNNIKKTKKHLKALRLEILNHFMEEDIKLYSYLNTYYIDDLQTTETIKKFEDTVKKIQKDVLKFLSDHSKDGVELDSLFKEKFTKVVNDLATRIETEEKNLYTLYVK